MLLRENLEQLIFEMAAIDIRLPGDGNGLAVARGGVLFDEMLDFVVVNVVCGMR